MQAEHINPFLKSLSCTFETMLGCQVRRGALTLADPNSPGYPISGVIGLSGKAVGTVVINVSEAVAIKAASVMLMEDLTTVDDDVLDAVGELANMVAGGAKAELEQYSMSVSLPNVVVGKDHAIRWPTKSDPICVPFDSDFGPLRLEVGLEVVNTATSV